MAEYISKNRIYDLINAVNSVNGFTSYEDYVGLLQDVETSTNANVQPLKRGRWIEVTPKHSRCSVCDTTCLIAVYPISKGANYCPNCGADMRTDENSPQLVDKVYNKLGLCVNKTPISLSDDEPIKG